MLDCPWRRVKLFVHGGSNGHTAGLVADTAHTLWYVLGGNTFFAVLFLEPQLRRLGPAIQRPVMGALMPLLTPAMMVSSLITIGTGVAMTLDLRWGSLDTLLSSGWGWAMLIGFAATIVAIVVGFGFTTPAGLRMEKLARGIQGGNPSSDEARDLERLSTRIETLSRTSFVFILTAVGAMAAARYV